MQWGYWLDTVERVARTVVQASAAAVLALWIQAGSFDQIDWTTMWQVAVFAGGAALLTAIIAKPVGNTDSPSFLEPPD